MMAVVTYSPLWAPPIKFLHPDRQPYRWLHFSEAEDKRDSKMHDCNFEVDVEGWSGERIERVICVDPLLSKRICSAGQ